MSLRAFGVVALLPVAAACGDTPLSTGPGGQIALPPGPYVPGQSYFGRNGYVEYIAGNSPVILSVPHGGGLRPVEIADRTASLCGDEPITVTDLGTIELALATAEAQLLAVGTRPHVIVSHLDRRKLDANRSIEAGACGSSAAEIAWTEFHAFIDVARDAILEAGDRGWYVDVHGHGHVEQRLELGYLLTGEALDLPDAALYERGGFPAVPSAGDPHPGTDPYFSGGYNTRLHTCGAGAAALGGASGGGICGVQVEANYAGVRDDATNRRHFGEATVSALEEYLLVHWDLLLPPPG